MIENQPKEITLIYHSDKAEDRKARAFIETLSGFAIKTIDLKRDSLTETQLAEIADKMNVTIDELLDATYKDRFQSTSFGDIHSVTDSDLLTVLKKEPMLLNTPITIMGKKAYSYSAAYELLTKDHHDEIQSSNGVKEAKRKIVF